MKFKRLISLLLTVAMVASFVNLTVFSAMTVAETHRVTFHLNGGTGTLDPPYTDVDSGEWLSGYPDMTNVTRNGYVFTGEWGTTASCVELWSSLNRSVTQDMTLYAWWKPLHAITFHLSGIELMEGTEPPVINENDHSNQVVDGMYVYTPVDPKAMGYLFDGWFADRDWTTPFDFSVPVTEPKTLFAKWQPANNVVFDINYEKYPLVADEADIEAPEIQQVLDGGYISAPSQPNRSEVGFAFAGWYTQKDIATVATRWDFSSHTVDPETGTMTLYAHWARIRFDSNWEGEKSDPDAYITNDGFLSDTSPQQRPNETVCNITDCSQKCDSSYPAMSGHGEEFSFAGWYRNAAGTGEPWVMGSGGTPVPFGNEQITLYAKWIPSYKVTFALNPENFSDLELKYPERYMGFAYSTVPLDGDAYLFLPALTAQRHIHEEGGWYKQQSLTNKWDSGTDVLRADTTLYAKWIPAWVITYDSNYDATEETEEYNLETRLVPKGATGNDIIDHISSVYHDTLHFGGWFRDKAGTVAWDIEAIINNDLTLYANWVEGTHCRDCGEIIAGCICAIVAFTIPTGFNFFLDPPFTIVNRTIVEFKTLEGTLIFDPINDRNRNRVVNGYSIMSWCTHNINCTETDCLWDFEEDTVPKGLTQLFANLQEAIRIDFDLNWPDEEPGERFYGGELDGIPFKYIAQATKGGALWIPDDFVPGWNDYPPAVAGEPLLTFAGWYLTSQAAKNFDESGLVDEDTRLSENSTLYAGWRNGFTVTFNRNFPSDTTAPIDVPSRQFVLPNTRATNPDPLGERPPRLEGHAFKGWFTDVDCTDENEWDFNDEVTADLILYAKWVETYIISFNLNYAGGQAPGDVVVARGDFVTNPARPTRPGWDLTGWYITAAAATANNPEFEWDLNDDRVTSRMTLFAGWVEVFDVSFDLNWTTDEAPPATNTRRKGDFVIRPTPPSRPGHTFVGWYTQKDANIETMAPWIFHEDTITEDTVLYAGWVAGVIVHPLFRILDEIMAAAVANNGQTFEVTMGSYTNIPLAIISIIKGRDVNLDLDMGGYIVHVRGQGLSAITVRNYIITTEVAYTGRILTATPQNAIDTFAAGRPVWQIRISGDLNSVASGITLRPPANHSSQYAVLLNRIGTTFEVRRQVRVMSSGEVSFDNLALGTNLGNGEFIIIISPTPMGGAVSELCPTCDWPVGNCRCPCSDCNKRPCECRGVRECGQCREPIHNNTCKCTVSTRCTSCRQIPCACLDKNCGECAKILANCLCPDGPKPICDECKATPCTCVPVCDTCGLEPCECCDTCDSYPCICCTTCKSHPCKCCNTCYTHPCECCNTCKSSPCICCVDCKANPCKCVSFILGNPSETGTVNITDALEILKYLAGLSNTVVKPGTPAWSASLITAQSISSNQPAIADVLEILKKLAGISNLVDNPLPRA